MANKKLAAAILYVLCVAAMAGYKNRHGVLSFSSTSGDVLQDCLNDRRRAAFEEDQKLKANLPKADEYPESPYKWKAVTGDQLPKLCRSGDLEQFKVALKRQAVRYKSLPPKSHEAMKFRFGCKIYSRQEYSVDLVTRMLRLAEGSASFESFIVRATQEFDWYKNDGRTDNSEKYPWLTKGTTQFTAYFVPEPFEATRKANGEFKFPIYMPPKGTTQIMETDPPEVTCGNDPITGKRRKFCIKKDDGTYVPLPTRREIDEQKVLEGQGLEIGYVKDPIDIAVMMVQGSGALNITEEDGRQHIIRANYAAANGQPRNMLSRILDCSGAPKSEWGSMNGIREFLERKGSDKFMYMNYDDSYVFFQESKIGPFGTGDIPITDRYSLATDITVMPTGSVALFNVERPEGKEGDCTDITTMAVAQDTGGAITGAHVDWYQGEGKKAAERANKVNYPGHLYVALPKESGRIADDCTP